MFDSEMEAAVRSVYRTGDRVTVLTGAGISAESGIPTFRGPEGYWTIGSKVYHPEDMATNAMFMQNPDETWRWYLNRLGVCRHAQPNPGHLALVELENILGDRFTLITQNVDGLHLRAGNSPERTFQIHGNIDFMRCSQHCTTEIYPLPDGMVKGAIETLTDADRRALQCPRCGSRTRPHVLWFDEFYDETWYRFQSSLAVAAQTELLIIVGTSGATSLPNQVALQVLENEGIIIDVNVQQNPFTELAMIGGGFFLQGESGTVLPELLKLFA